GSDIEEGPVLVRGPQFRAIQSLDGVSADGAAAMIAGARELGWAGTCWNTDPAAVDGGLQLATLWAERVLGGASLPMALSEYRVHRLGLFDGPARCLVRGKQAEMGAAPCDLVLIDTHGAISAHPLD